MWMSMVHTCECLWCIHVNVYSVYMWMSEVHTCECHMQNSQTLLRICGKHTIDRKASFWIDALSVYIHVCVYMCDVCVCVCMCVYMWMTPVKCSTPPRILLRWFAHDRKASLWMHTSSECIVYTRGFHVQNAQLLLQICCCGGVGICMIERLLSEGIHPVCIYTWMSHTTLKPSSDSVVRKYFIDQLLSECIDWMCMFCVHSNVTCNMLKFSSESAAWKDGIERLLPECIYRVCIYCIHVDVKCRIARLRICCCGARLFEWVCMYIYRIQSLR